MLLRPLVVNPIRLVTFDALYTIITPRLPVHIQYSQTFAPYLGVLDPHSLQRSFRLAFGSLESEQPVYTKGSQAWWSEVIRRTALGADADPDALEASLPTIVSRLMTRFGSKEGYRVFDDAIPAVRRLREMNIMAAVISNSDSRLRTVLQDLDFPLPLNSVILSEEEGFEKPSPEIFLRAISLVSQRAERQGRNPIKPEECLHVGDELESDYNGALAAGMKALLLQRSGLDGEQAHKRPGQETITAVRTVKDLGEVIHWVETFGTFQ